MNNFALEIWDDESSLVTFFTIRMEGAELTEMEKFLKKFENDQEHSDELNEIVTLLLDYMGEERGAIIELFNRQENTATALPPIGKIAHELGFGGGDFSLRLYCLRLTDEVVILFNGGVKTSQTAQDSPGVSMIMKEADKFAQIILREWQRTIFLDESGMRIVDSTGSTDIYF